MKILWLALLLVFFVRAEPIDFKNGLVQTYAGTGEVVVEINIIGIGGYNGDNIKATSAQFKGPRSCCRYNVPPNTVFCADTRNHRIRAISTDGTITTVAGTGAAASTGADGTPATAASINWPHTVTCDSNQFRVFFAERSGHQVRYIKTDSNQIMRVAGNGTAGSSPDGLALNATLNGPTGVFYYPDNDELYIADALNYKIKKVAMSSGVMTTIAGSGIQGLGPTDSNALLAQIGYVEGLAYSGTFTGLLFADSTNHCIRKVDSNTGELQNVTGTCGQRGYTGDEGPVANALLDYPVSIELDGLAYYITDYGNNAVRRVRTDRDAITTIGGGPNATRQSGSLFYDTQLLGPTGTVLNTDDKQLLVVQADASIIIQVNETIVTQAPTTTDTPTPTPTETEAPPTTTTSPPTIIPSTTGAPTTTTSTPTTIAPSTTTSTPTIVTTTTTTSAPTSTAAPTTSAPTTTPTTSAPITSSPTPTSTTTSTPQTTSPVTTTSQAPAPVTTLVPVPTISGPTSAPVIVTLKPDVTSETIGNTSLIPKPNNVNYIVLFSTDDGKTKAQLVITPPPYTLTSLSIITQAIISLEIVTLAAPVTIEIVAQDANKNIIGRVSVQATQIGTLSIDVAKLFNNLRRGRQIIINGKPITFTMNVLTPDIPVNVVKTSTTVTLSVVSPATPTPTLSDASSLLLGTVTLVVVALLHVFL